MAHNLEFNDETQTHNMFCVGDVSAAWHHLGQRTPDAVNWSTAMELAGLNWQVVLQPIFARRPNDKVVTQVSGNAAFRSTDGAVLGIVGADYQPIQNRYAFDFVDSLLEAENGAHYESAGALGCGERIWCLARVPNSDFNVLGVDPHQMYLLFATSHDGSMSAVAKLSDVRVVCQNTFNTALAHAGTFARIRHTKNAMAKLDECKSIMRGVAIDAKQLGDKLNMLAERRMMRESMNAILDRLFPKPDPKQNQTRRDNLISEVLSLYESNDENKIASIRGSAYNLFNAVTQYTDHYRTARLTEDKKLAGYTLDKARAEAAMFGSGESLKTDALETILQLTADAPSMVSGGPTVAVVEAIETESPAMSPKLQADIDKSIADLDFDIPR